MKETSTLFGTGIDIVDKDGMKKIMEKSSFERFKDKWLTLDERNYLNVSSNQEQDFAVIFSIKEAFIKASNGQVILKDFPYINVNISNKKRIFIGYRDNEFFINKKCFIVTVMSNTFILSSVTIFHLNKC